MKQLDTDHSDFLTCVVHPVAPSENSSEVKCGFLFVEQVKQCWMLSSVMGHVLM